MYIKRTYLYSILLILTIIVIGLIIFLKINCCFSENKQSVESRSELCSDTKYDDWTCSNIYGGLYLKAFDINMNWNKAEEMCLSEQQQDAHLVSVVNDDQNERLRELVRQSNFSSNCKNYWIGAEWNRESNLYQWTDGSNSTEYLTKKLNAQLLSQETSAPIAVNSQMDWITINDSTNNCFICVWNRINSDENAKDCKDLKKFGKKITGTYNVKIENSTKRLKIMCEMDHSDGGWTVIQQRFDGTLVFWNRTWQEYRNGFGTIGKHYEFWAGNEFLHQLTSKSEHTHMRIELHGDRNPNSTIPDGYWESEYQEIKVGNESTDYTLHIKEEWGSVTGNASATWFDITYANGFKFSTIDRINDPQPECVTRYHLGGWWLHYCTFSALNGEYEPPYQWSDGYGMMWITTGHRIINPRISRIMFRKKS